MNNRIGLWTMDWNSLNHEGPALVKNIQRIKTFKVQFG